jgi:CRISPR-associated protein Csm2
MALQRIYSRLKMLKSKVEYASNPKNPKIPSFFKDWLIRGIDEVNPNDPRDFEAFLLHFEAVVGFCYGLGLSNN